MKIYKLCLQANRFRENFKSIDYGKWIIKSDILKKGYIIHKVELEAK